MMSGGEPIHAAGLVFILFCVFFKSFQTTHLKYAFAPNEPSPFLMSALTIKGTLYLFLFFGGESENWKLGSENCCWIFNRKTFKKKKIGGSHSALFPIGGNSTNAHERGSAFMRVCITAPAFFNSSSSAL